MKNFTNKIKTLLIVTLFSGLAFSQSVRSLNNDGVDLYSNKKFPEAEVNFKKALDKKLENVEGHFNLGDALYKQDRFEEAIKSYQNALALSKSDLTKSGIFHNIGNSLLKSKKLKESVEAYKNALKLNPGDYETKYNLSYALEMMKQQQKQKKQNKNNKNDKNKKDNKKKNDKNKDKNKNKDQNKKDNKDQKNKNDQNKDQKNNKDQNQKNKQNQQQQKQQQKPQPNKISKAEAQRILNALKNNESDLQKKLRVKKGKVVKKEKDW
ncbi:MAG: tetratricopeptide repeat protein [Rhodothermaceae bacterium]